MDAISNCAIKFEMIFQPAEGGAIFPVTLKIYPPTLSKSMIGDYECVYLFEGLSDEAQVIYGQNPIQSALLALKVAGADLAGMAKIFRIKNMETGNTITADIVLESIASGSR